MSALTVFKSWKRNKTKEINGVPKEFTKADNPVYKLENETKERKYKNQET